MRQKNNQVAKNYGELILKGCLADNYESIMNESQIDPKW